MGSEKTQARFADTRQRIIDSARNIILGKGYAAVGLLPAALIPAEGVLFRLIVWAAASGGLALAHLVVALLSRLAVEKRERPG